MSLPTEAKARKDTPIARGVLDYFPDAVAAVAELSRIGNEQHNPGQAMHWDKSKSTDHADCIARHLIDRGKLDTDGVRHSAKVAWRALALLQIELEATATKEGWIEWHGGGRPSVYKKVCVTFRGGGMAVAYPSEVLWSHTGGPGDIVAYKIETPKVC